MLSFKRKLTKTLYRIGTIKLETWGEVSYEHGTIVSEYVNDITPLSSETQNLIFFLGPYPRQLQMYK